MRRLLCCVLSVCSACRPVESNSGVLNHNTTTQKKGKRGAVRRYCHVDCTLKALGLSLMGFFERLFLGAEAVTVPTYKIPGVNPRTPFFFFLPAAPFLFLKRWREQNSGGPPFLFSGLRRHLDEDEGTTCRRKGRKESGRPRHPDECSDDPTKKTGHDQEETSKTKSVPR